MSRTDFAQKSVGLGHSPPGKVKFPLIIKYRKAEVTIYGKTAAYAYYRLNYYVAGKRQNPTFSKFSDAKEHAKTAARDISKGNQTGALTRKEVADAFAIRDALASFRNDTGRQFTALEAVSGFLEAMRHLPQGCGLTESVKSYANTLSTVTPKLISEAVEQFITVRQPKTLAPEGKRPQLSPKYAENVASGLRKFAAMFPGHMLGDLNQDLLTHYLQSLAKLSSKSRNDQRSYVKMFLQWCVKQKFLISISDLLEVDAMEKENLDTAPTDFYRPDEFRSLLESSDGQMRAVIALQGLAGIRLDEALRLKWERVFGKQGYVEITAQDAKTRKQRLVPICPALALWLEPYKGSEGKIWTETATLNGFVSRFATLRKTLKIPSRKNGLRHAFCTYHFAAYDNENLTSSQAGNTPTMLHAHYKGLATKAEAEKWFNVMPPASAKNVIHLKAAALT